MQVPKLKIIRGDQQGSTPILLVLVVAGVALGSIKLLGNRSEQQLRYLAHEKIKFEINLVKSIVASKLACEDWLKANCVDGTVMNLKETGGGILANADGKSKIANWNAKSQCNNSEFQLYASKRNDAGEIAKDPLTKKPLDWAPILNLKSQCIDSTETITVMGNPCYACEDGTISFNDLPYAPAELKAAAIKRAADQQYCTNKACDPGQRSYPPCPSGYYAVGHLIDRYGWGGVDFTKSTTCRKK